VNYWEGFDQVSCLPFGCQCEAPRDDLIRQPSSFWSSLAYIFAGIPFTGLITVQRPEIKMWASACILMGLSSMFAHMSFIDLAMVFDFSSIILMVSFFSFLNFFKKFSAPVMLTFLSAWYLFIFLMIYFMDGSIKMGFCFVVFAISFFDLIRDAGKSFFNSPIATAALIILFFSFVMFLIDELHLICDPKSWFQLHSLWHIGTSISIFLFGKWWFELKQLV
jgi:hypothetical protein